MYEKKTKSWLKYRDFILLDVLCLQVAFVLGCMMRHGLMNPYASMDYLKLAAVYTLVDIHSLIMGGTMENVLKRGYYKELAQTAGHVFYVMLVVSLYMFAVQTGLLYSRIVFFLVGGLYLVISYTARLVWKRILKQKMPEDRQTAFYFIFQTHRQRRCTEQ